MSLGTDSISWWESNGPGCKVFFYPNHTGIEEDAFKPVRPDLITGCVMNYQKIETAQASLQILLAVSYYLFILQYYLYPQKYKTNNFLFSGFWYYLQLIRIMLFEI